MLWQGGFLLRQFQPGHFSCDPGKVSQQSASVTKLALVFADKATSADAQWTEWLRQHTFMAMTYSFRAGKPSDALACAQIIRDWGDESPWLDPLDELQPLAAFWCEVFRKDTVWIAEKNDTIVGFCVREDEFICGLYVAREARNHGLGKQLLDLAKEGRDRIVVWAYEANEQARKFYRREGLIEICREVEDGTGLMNVEHRWTGPT